MEQFRKFLRDKAFALVLTACLLAAAAAGVWAVRTHEVNAQRDALAVAQELRKPTAISSGNVG